jgi:hypothetical protein
MQELSVRKKDQSKECLSPGVLVHAPGGATPRRGFSAGLEPGAPRKQTWYHMS